MYNRYITFPFDVEHPYDDINETSETKIEINESCPEDYTVYCSNPSMPTQLYGV